LGTSVSPEENTTVNMLFGLKKKSSTLPRLVHWIPTCLKLDKTVTTSLNPIYTPLFLPYAISIFHSSLYNWIHVHTR